MPFFIITTERRVFNHYAVEADTPEAANESFLEGHYLGFVDGETEDVYVSGGPHATEQEAIEKNDLENLDSEV